MKLTDDKKVKEQNGTLFENIEDIERISDELKKSVPNEEAEGNKGKLKMEMNGVSKKCANGEVTVNVQKAKEEENENNLNLDIKEQEKKIKRLTEDLEKLGIDIGAIDKKEVVAKLDKGTGELKHGEKNKTSSSLFESGSVDVEIKGHSVKSSSVEDVTASMDKLGLESRMKIKEKDVAKPDVFDLKALMQGLSEEQTEAEEQNLKTVEIIAQPEKKCEENEDFEETRVLSNAWDYKTDENRCSSFVGRGPFGGIAKDTETHDLKEILRKNGDNYFSDVSQPRKFVRPSPMEVYNPIMSGGYVQVVQSNVHPHSLYDVRHLEELNISSQYLEQRTGNFLWPANSEVPAEQPFYNGNLSSYPAGCQVVQHRGPFFDGSPNPGCAVYPPGEDFPGGYEYGANTKWIDSELFPNYPLEIDQGKNGMPYNTMHCDYQFHGHLESQNIPFSSSHSPHDHRLTSPGSSPPSVLSYPLSPTSTILTNGDADLCDLSVLSPGQFPLSPPESGFVTDISGDASRDLDDALAYIEEDMAASSTKANANSGSLLPVVVEIAGSDPMSEVGFGSAGSPCQSSGNVSRPAEPKKQARQARKGPRHASKAPQPAPASQMKILPPVTGGMMPNAVYSSSGVSAKQLSTAIQIPCFVFESLRSDQQQQSAKPHLVPIRPKKPTELSAQSATKPTQPADVSPSALPSFSPPVMQLSPQEPTVTSSSDPDQLVKAYRAVAGLPKEQLLGQDDDGDTILHLAIVKEKTKLVKALLERYVREELIDKVINLANKQHQTPLCLAVFLNQTEIVKMLIERKADVNVQLQRKLNGGLKCYRLIHYAASRGKKWVPTLIQLLSADNIDLQAFNSEGCTAMHCAIECHGKPQQGEEKIDSKDTIYHLAMRGADLNVQHGLCGKTPLHYAIEKKDSDLVGWFLGLASFMQSASGPKKSNGGRSQELVHSLLNAKPSGGVTALQLALGLQMESTERIPILQMLLRDGAEVSQRGSDGKLRQELAKFPELTGLLKNGTSSMKNGTR